MTDPTVNHELDNSEDLDESFGGETIAAEVDAKSAAAGDDRPQYGVGPFSIREVALVGVWLVAFAISFFSLSTVGFSSLWTSGLDWILSIGVPTVAVFLIVLRRLSPDGIRRVGSLGIDQFASVAFAVSAMLWVQITWSTVTLAINTGIWAYSWVLWVELILMLAGVVLTVFAPILPVIGEDFHGRREIVAHRNARPIRPVVAAPPRERRPRPEAAPIVDEQNAPEESAARDEFDNDGDTGAYDQDVAPQTARYSTDSQDLSAYAAPTADDSGSWPNAQGSADTAAAASGPQPTVSHQAFWALTPVDRDVVDERGNPLFRVGPTAWALVIEDHGSMFVVRHEDGRVGYLHDISGVTRG